MINDYFIYNHWFLLVFQIFFFYFTKYILSFVIIKDITTATISDKIFILKSVISIFSLIKIKIRVTNSLRKYG